MVRFALCIVLLVSVGPLSTCQDISSQPVPKILLKLPADIPSEIVHINYFMTGPFGEYGGFVTPNKSRSNYEIIAAVDGKPAARVKLIVYAPGCQIESLDIQVQSQTVSRQLLCTPLAQKVLHGQITPASIPQQPSEVEVTYLAMWDHHFFGIYDGFITAIRVTAGIPDQDGNFVVNLPDFIAQPNLGEGEFQFTLREIKTGNIIAFLYPAGDARGRLGMKVEASYPPLIRFSSMRPQ
jgi:hypothetical protein